MTSNSKRIVRFIIDILIIAILTGFDQITKYLAVEYLKDKPAFKIIDRVFELNYLENRGAAFGMLQNQKIFFVIIAVVMLFIVCFTLIKMPTDRKYIFLRICMVLVGAGAIGNLIDRLSQDYVVDFFYFVLINFPIFNVADIYVSVSCVVLAILILFVYKEDDLAFLKIKKEADGEV